MMCLCDVLCKRLGYFYTTRVLESVVKQVLNLGPISGVPDVDCPNNGLCCFDGCANRCEKNCYNDVVSECVDVEEEACQDEPAEACQDEEVSVPCESVCSTVGEQVCEEVVEQVGYLDPLG